MKKNEMNLFATH